MKLNLSHEFWHNARHAPLAAGFSFMGFNAWFNGRVRLKAGLEDYTNHALSMGLYKTFGILMAAGAIYTAALACNELINAPRSPQP